MLKPEDIELDEYFICDEYIEQIREYATQFTSDLNYIKNIVQNADYELDNTFQNNIIIIINNIIKKIDKIIDNILRFQYPDNLNETYFLHYTVGEYENLVSYSLQAIDQRIEGYASEQIHFHVPSKIEFNTPRIYKAIDNLVTFFFYKFFPTDVARDFIPMTIFSNVPGYQISFCDTTAIVQIPKSDQYRFRFWTALGHEIAHQKYRKTRLKGSYAVLRQNIVEDLTNLGKKVWKAGDRYSAFSQFQEIICDLSSLALIGPADLLTLIVSASHPRLEADSLDAHPPLSVRANYMFKFLINLEPDFENSYSQQLKKWKSAWSLIERTISLTEDERLYISEYNKIVEQYYPELVKLAKNFLELPNDYFVPKRWEEAEDAYTLMKKGKSIENLDIDVINLLNMMWIKRWDILKIFRNTSTQQKNLRYGTVPKENYLKKQLIFSSPLRRNDYA
jgi:hypothetical protein